MAITRRTSNGIIETFSGTAGTGHTINLSDAAIGDVRTVEISGNPDGTGTVGSLTLPSGWSWAGTQTETGAASTGMLSVIYRVVQSGDTLTSATLALTYNNSVMVASTAETWEGVDNTTPLDQTVPTYATGSSPPVSPSITTQTDGALLICAALVDGAPTWGDGDIPSGFTLNGTIVNNPPSNGQNHGSAYQIQATAGASGTKSWTNGGTEEYVAMTYALRPAAAEGITSIDPTTFDMDAGDVDINGLNFLATQGSGTVYISDADTLAGSVNEVEIANGINTWSDTVVNLDLTGLNATELSNLHTLGPGTRYVIVVNNDSDEYGSDAITLHRPQAFVMSLGAGTPGATTARLTAPATKTTGDFDAGRFEEAANPATAVNITADNYTEMVWSIEAKALSRTVSYDFRVTKNGTVIDTYTVTPQVTVSSGDSLTMEGIKTTPTVGAPALGQTHVLSVEGIKTNPTVGAPTLGQVHSLSVDGIKTTPTVGAPTAGHIHVLDVEGIKSTPTVGTPAVGQTHALTVEGIKSTPTVGAPSIGQTHVLSINGIKTEPTVGSPSLGQTHSLSVEGIKSTPTVGAPTLGHIHVLSVEGIKVSPTVGSPTLGTEGEDILSVEGIKVSPTVGSPALGQVHALALEGIKVSPTVGAPIFEHIHTLSTDGIKVSPTVGAPSLGQVHALSIGGIKVTPTVGAPTLGVEGSDSLTMEGIKATPTVGSPALGQTHALTTDGIRVSPAVGLPAFGQTHVLGVEGIKVTPTVGAPLIEHIHALTMEGIKVTPTAGSPVLEQIHNLIPGGIAVSPTVGNVTIGQTHVLTMEGIKTSPTVGAPTLSKFDFLLYETIRNEVLLAERGVSRSVSISTGGTSSVGIDKGSTSPVEIGLVEASEVSLLEEI